MISTINPRISSNFDDTFIKGANIIFEGILNSSRGIEYPLEFRYANLRLPRQSGKTTYMRGLANLLAAPMPTETRNVYFCSGVFEEKNAPIPLSNYVRRISFHDIKSFADINMEMFRGLTIDVILFDEVKPIIADCLLKHDIFKVIMSSSDNFVALGLHTL